MLKKIIIVVITLAVVLAALFFSGRSWIRDVIPKTDREALKATVAADIPYLANPVAESRGRILAVVTSVDKMGNSGEDTGYEFTELSRAYWVFKVNGFEVDVASTQGGKAPVVYDDMSPFDYAFLNDPKAKQKIDNTLVIDDVNPEDYEAVYFVGGKGAMFDFPENAAIKNLTKHLYQNNKVVAAVCHGPAALVNVTLDNGEYLVANKKVSSFTNEEELTLIPDAPEIFPFLLQDKLSQQGADFEAGISYLEQVSHDGKLLTGQNPWSVWPLAEQMIAELGYQPVPRNLTGEEHSVSLLTAYENNGYDHAVKVAAKSPNDYNRIMILMHGVVAFMQFEITKGLDLLFLVDELKELQG